MSWDWDKLQERRQRQRFRNPLKPPPRAEKEEEDDEEDEGGEEELESPRDSKESRDRSRSRWGGSSGSGRGGGNDDLPPLLRLARMKPPSGRAVWLIIPIGIILWLLTGIFIVNPDEEGVVLRFGKYDRTEGPGPHYAWPMPIEQVHKPRVTQVMRSEVGFRSVGQQTQSFQQGQLRTVPEEASMLTGDENIVNVQFSIQYKISNAVDYLFNVADPTALVRNAAEAAMREVIGNSQIDAAITDGKLKIQSEATQLLQRILDSVGSGIQVLAVQLQDVHPPQDVIDAFKDVASAREDKSRIINEAEAYRNELLPKARGQAAALRNQAEAYSTTRIQTATGEASRFDALRIEYEKAPKVTRQRLYYEAMEEILSGSSEKVLLDSATGGKALPFLPIPGLSDPTQSKPPAAKK
ncbi:MAG: FtsH protease activity modulator HflK [Desulfovibrio sp.]|jgi:membrane protease subunit HflK|nr:FtsH protease activity modulator HflK [Desulfovibrio sp.]